MMEGSVFEVYNFYKVLLFVMLFKVLVHGEQNEMSRLKSALIREYEDDPNYNIDIHNPRNTTPVAFHFRGEKMAKVSRKDFQYHFLIRCGTPVRVATAQGKQEIWMFIFPDRENTRNLPKKYLKYDFTQGICLQHGDNFEVLK